MASKFGLLGDLDNLLCDVRRNVRSAALAINLVRRALAEGAVGRAHDGLSPERAAALLEQAAKELDAVAP
jgi:hypothetical protein